MSVQLCLQGSTGELLDAQSSCCPGGFQAVLGSFCPCVAALLLRAAQQMALPQQAELSPLVSRGWCSSTISVHNSQAAVHIVLMCLAAAEELPRMCRLCCVAASACVACKLRCSCRQGRPKHL
jgi:hypothetical protein